MKRGMFLTLLCILTTSCVMDNGKISIDLIGKNKTSTIAQAKVSNVQIINNELVVTGSNLSGVTNIKVNGQSFDESFSIETNTATKITAKSIRAFSFDITKAFNVILSDANASASFPIDFSLCNSLLNGKSLDCTVAAQDGDVLAFNQGLDKWVPTAVAGAGTPAIGANGYAKLTLNSSEPVTCGASTAGSIAMNSDGDLCTCKSGATEWIGLLSSTSCVWSVPACPATVQASGLTAGQTSATCRCSAAQTAAGSVSGSSDSYTDSSSICRAALHEGYITASGADIVFNVDAGESSYTGTTSNGVTSTSSGATALKLRFYNVSTPI